MKEKAYLICQVCVKKTNRCELSIEASKVLEDVKTSVQFMGERGGIRDGSVGVFNARTNELKKTISGAID